MGVVFDIQKFCVNDGPGIRSVVFLKGCPLKCLWCHNPESNSIKPKLYCEWSKCISCGKCVSVCENNVHEIKKGKHIVHFEKCTMCGKCIEVCTNEAMGCYGYNAQIEEVIKEVEKDKNYYAESGGGVTISGGEPMAQFKFTYELAKELFRRKINVCIETSGFSNKDYFEKIAQYVDCFLFDYKATGEEKHIYLTGVSNKEILNNLLLLTKMKKKVILRCPIIPGQNLSEDHLKAIADLSNKGVHSVEIIPYHNMGVAKAKKIGSGMYLSNVKIPRADDVENWIEKIKKYGGINIKKS